MALKVIPWGDVIEHAPSVLKAARKLMDRQPAQPTGQPGAPATTTPVSAVPSLGELKNALIAAQGQIERQAQTQRELTETRAWSAPWKCCACAHGCWCGPVWRCWFGWPC
jgi:hypothetical protein